MVCTLGDLLLDVIVRLDGPIAADTDTYGVTHVGAGGQAANVAAWVGALGGRARFVGKRARDPAGELVAGELRRRDVDVVGPDVERGTGTVVSIATPDGKRTMLTDRGVAPDLGPDETDEAWFQACEWLHLPGYSLVREPLASAARAAAAIAPRVSVDVSSPSAVEAFGVDAFRRVVDALKPDLVLANEAEAALVDAVRTKTLVVKLGARGCRVDGRAYTAPPVEVVDTTGAGDAFAAGFLVGGPELALEAAARCVQTMGAMPDG
jgi:ribokinase